MITIPKLLFDECVGKPLVDQLRALLTMAVDENSAELRHILEIYKEQGTSDDVWIPHVATSGYIVITQDLGRSGGPKLPRLCVEYGITHVLLSPVMGRRKKLEKALSILSVWYEVLALASRPPGLRFQLEPNGPGRGRLVPKEIKGKPGDLSPEPDMLFNT